MPRSVHPTTAATVATSMTAAALAPLVALALVLTLAAYAPVTPASAAGKPGRVHGDSRALVPGCRKAYTYDYRVRVPSDDWSLEITIRNPAGKAIHSAAYLGKPGKQGDPQRRNNIRYKFCRRVTGPGVYVIRAKLTYAEDTGSILGGTEDRVARFRDRFRLTR